MKDLKKLFDESLMEVKAAGLQPGNIISVKPNKNMTKSWGVCSSVMENGERKFKIDISTRILQDNVDDIATKDTIIHEILHTCPDGFGHTGKWAKYADIINYTYKGKYNIKRTTAIEEKGIEFDSSQYKYVIKCEKCGIQDGYTRKCNVVKIAALYEDALQRGDDLKKIRTVRCAKCRGVFRLIKGRQYL